MKRIITAAALAALILDVAAIGITRNAERIPVSVPTEGAAPPTAAEEIVPGVCTFGGCAASSEVTEPETEAPERGVEDTAPYEENAAEAACYGGTVVTCWVTAYCGCYACSEGWGSMTATGAVARPNHTVAVDPGVIPYGTRLVINGVTYTAEDCGGGVNGYSIDVYFEEHRQCEAWATGWYDVTIC